jgi:putative spermidine/putrescine transport system permease protein
MAADNVLADPFPAARSAGLSRDEMAIARRALRRRRLTALLLVVPLLLFILFAFFAPIATMLHRSVYNPTVVGLIPDTLQRLESWDGKGTPDAPVLAQMAIDLKRLQNERAAGKLGEELNRGLPGSSSLVKSTARKLRSVEDAELEGNGAALLLEINEKWASPDLWIVVRDAGRVYTINNFLTALDLERTSDGGIQLRESAQVYVQLYVKTLRIALVITVLCILLGYPLSFYLSTAPPTTANLLMVLVLLPFWTSLLVRTSAWIALLQTNGVINSVLMAVGITGEPLEMLYTEFATTIAMTHILLPFMVLPLYSVMKGIDPSYMRAAMSLGSRPIPAFVRVYFPMTMPGLSAGALLVFIISVGYYITPALVGGTSGQMISNIIAFHMQQSNNWELAAALGSLLLALILVLYWIYDRLVGADNIKLG